MPTDAAAPSAADTPGADVPAPSPAVPAAATPGGDAVGYRDGGGAGTRRHVRHRDADGRVSPPPPRPLFGDRWPGPAGPIAGDLLACVVAFGVVLATAAPESPTGVGWLFTASVATAMTIMVAWGRRSRHPLTPADVGWTLPAVALATVGTVRAAEWLAALCLLAAAAAAALAVARPVVPRRCR